MFFEYFPKTTFSLSKTEDVLVTDFLRAVKLDNKLKEDNNLFDVYVCSDNETPEIISHKVYRSTSYHWIIMLMNEKFDPFNDFPKDDYTLIKYATEKYADINATHHYVDSDGNIVDEFTTEKIPVSNIDHERNLNNDKRLIKILKKEALSEFVQQYKNLIAI